MGSDWLREKAGSCDWVLTIEIEGEVKGFRERLSSIKAYAKRLKTVVILRLMSQISMLVE